MRLLSYSTILYILAAIIPLQLFSANTIAVQDGNWDVSTTWAESLLGTISLSSGSTTVTGASSSFTTEILVNDRLYDSNGALLGTVASITDDFNLELTGPVTVTQNNISAYSTYPTGTFPTSTGENNFVIPVGIAVTIPAAFNSGNLSSGMFTNMDIYGELIAENEIAINEWEIPHDQIVIHTGGKFSCAGDFAFYTDRADLTIEQGAELYIGGGLNDGGTGGVNISNNGYIEVNGDIISKSIALTNEETGVLVVHGNISGAGAVFIINNYGIITADHDLDLTSVELYNKKEGQVLVFGNLSITGSSSYFNEGLVQCLNMTFDNLTGFSNDGTTIIQEVFDLNWGGCPCSLGDFYAGIVEVNGTPSPPSGHWNSDDGCGLPEYTSCGQYWTSMPVVPESRKIWIAADYIGNGLGYDGEPVYRWFDLGNSYGFKLNEPDANYQPELKNNSTDNLNYNPVVSFSGGEKHLDLDGNYMFADATDGGIAFLAVVIPESGGSADQLLLDFGNNTDEGYGFGYSADNTYMYTPTAHNGSVLQIADHGRDPNPTLLTMKTVFGGTQSIYYNGALSTGNTTATTTLDATTISANATPTGSAGPVTIGAASNDPSSFAFEGKLAELMIYSKNLHDTTRISAQSYLALKYGLTLPHDYTDYNNKTIWVADGTYQYDITGLAREDLNFLHQRIATSSNNPGELIVSMGDIDGITDKSQLTQRIDTNSTYLIWGHDNGSLATGERIYKITSTQFNQDVNLQFDVPGLTETPIFAVADDESFSTNLDFATASSHVGDKINYSYHFKKNKTCYFKLLIVNPVKGEPGVGINTTDVDSTAQLHIVSTDKGILLPALTDETAISSPTPPTGLLFYNTTYSRFMYNAGTAASPEWKFIGAPIVQSNTDLLDATGSYKGEIRYDSTNKVMWMWDGSDWLQLKND